MGGGPKASTSASLMCPVFMKNSPTSCGVATLRSFQCFWVTKMVAALLRKPPPRKSKPVKAIASWFAGFDLMTADDLVYHLVGALERRAVGQEYRSDVVPLVLVGHEGARRRSPQATVAPTITRKSTAATAPRRIIHETPST